MQDTATLGNLLTGLDMSAVITVGLADMAVLDIILAIARDDEILVNGIIADTDNGTSSNSEKGQITSSEVYTGVIELLSRGRVKLLTETKENFHIMLLVTRERHEKTAGRLQKHVFLVKILIFHNYIRLDLNTALSSSCCCAGGITAGW